MHMRCLVVDDDRTVLRAAKRYLSHRGFDVELATSGAESRAHAGAFDCIVLDIELGAENGIDLAREFMGTKTDCIVFFSGSTDLDIRLSASEYGTFIAKEAGLHALASAIEAAIIETQQAVMASGADAPQRSRADPRLESGFRRKR